VHNRSQGILVNYGPPFLELGAQILDSGYRYFAHLFLKGDVRARTVTKSTEVSVSVKFGTYCPCHFGHLCSRAVLMAREHGP